MFLINYRKQLLKLKTLINSLPAKEEEIDQNMKDNFYQSAIACYGNELIDYYFTSNNNQMSLILPIIKSETENQIFELTRQIWGVSHYDEITKNIFK